MLSIILRLHTRAMLKWDKQGVDDHHDISLYLFVKLRRKHLQTASFTDVNFCRLGDHLLLTLLLTGSIRITSSTRRSVGINFMRIVNLERKTCTDPMLLQIMKVQQYSLTRICYFTSLIAVLLKVNVNNDYFRARVICEAFTSFFPLSDIVPRNTLQQSYTIHGKYDILPSNGKCSQCPIHEIVNYMH